ncbi:MAG: zf-TFIIB domain-containing protein [candidate division NC10 bacterium]
MPVKPSDKEEEYFTRLEVERKRKLDEERHGQLKEEERKRMKALHFMRCPKCGMELQEIDFKGIKIDKCFGCEGLWLDAGEIISILELERTMMDRLFSIFKK